MGWTLRQFKGALEEMTNIMKLEAGTEDTPISLTGKSAMTLGKMILPRYRGKK